MSAFTVGGADIASLTLTYSWGLSPASGDITVPGAEDIAAGTEVALNLGGLVFFGVVTKSTVLTNDGHSTQLELVDNRIKLMWDDVYCSFNNMEVREDNPSTPGIDRQKRFWHIQPEDWDAQMKTWTDEPYTAEEIIYFLMAADTVSNTWLLETHPAQDAPVLGVDANHGPKLGTVLQEISERQGLVFTLVGENTLRWARKGDGAAHTVPAGAFDIRDGDALSHNDTQVRLVGDRNTYQDMPVELQADWLSHYEDFWSEPAWFARCDELFGPFDADTAGQAALAAIARRVTLREYAAAAGGGADDELYSDRAMWGEVSRMEIPVWLYLRDIVFKAYAVPAGFTINGIPLDSLELHEGLLAAVQVDIDSGVLSLKSPREFYPDTKAFIAAKGQQLGLLDPRTQNVLTSTQLTEARTKWTPCNKFNLDTKNKLVIFQDAVFLPGEGANGLFIFPNQDVEDIADTHELYHIAVPNADVTVQAAEVRAVMVFEAELYSKRYGSGLRKGSRVVKDLCYHALCSSGAFTEEVKYADGEGADEKAEREADALILSEAVYRAGGYRRPGTCGTALSAVLDRVSVTVNFEEGMVEAVEHTKERNQSNFEHEREMDRRARQRDLFPSQKANATEVENLYTISRISKELPRTATAPYRSAAEVLQRPVGAPHCAPRTIKLPTAKAAGAVVWLDASGAVANAGTRLAGVVIADDSVGSQVALATQGTVPVKIKGPFAAGDVVGADGATPAKIVSNGARAIGTVNASYTGTEEVLAPVRLGAGGGSAALQLQAYDASTGSTPKIGVTDGQVYSGGSRTPRLGGAPISNATPPTLTVSPSDTVVYLKLDLNSEGVVGSADGVTILSGASVPANSDDTAYLKIADIVVTTGATASVKANPVISGSQAYNRCRDWFESPPSYTHDFKRL